MLVKTEPIKSTSKLFIKNTGNELFPTV